MSVAGVRVMEFGLYCTYKYSEFSLQFAGVITVITGTIKFMYTGCKSRTEKSLNVTVTSFIEQMHLE